MDEAPLPIYPSAGSEENATQVPIQFPLPRGGEGQGEGKRSSSTTMFPAPGNRMRFAIDGLGGAALEVTR